MSPDGKQLAYTARRGDTSQLYLRALDRLEPKLVPDSEGAYIPFFSPDSHWVGFFAQGKLKKAAIAGGAPQDICAAGDGIGASWGSDDMIYFAPQRKEVANPYGHLRVASYSIETAIK